jgi:tetratricopeptide (TPR) repeat protein
MSGLPSRKIVTRLDQLLVDEEDRGLAERAVREGRVSEAELKEALEEQARAPSRRLRSIFTDRGRLSAQEFDALLTQWREERRSAASGGGTTPTVPDEVRPHLADPSRALAEFVLVLPLGEGGAGEVWKAWDRLLGRWVAVKISRAATPTARERFRQEARAIARLKHPNIIPIYRVSGEGERPYIVMPLVEGQTLDRASLPLGRALEVLRTATLAVDHAHRQGIVHRDLKPGNIMVDAAGGVWVLDFGLAYHLEDPHRLTISGTVIGTPCYMSPEQALGSKEAHEPATDIYSLGATLYELACGVPPFRAESFAQIVEKVRHEDPVPPRRVRTDLDRETETIILKAMEKNPRRRYASAGDLAEDLRRRLEGDPVLARPAGRLYRLLVKVRKNRLGAALGLSTVLAGSVALAVWADQRGSADRLDRERRAGAARYDHEREASLKTLRETARVSLDAALGLRRKGAQAKELMPYFEALKAAYVQAKDRAPDSAEVEYLMGRMRRVITDHEVALETQERALRCDPDYAPALYEHALLLTQRYGREIHKASPGTPDLAPEEIETARPALLELHRRIVQDCTNLERVLAARHGGKGVEKISEANVRAARGILAYQQGKYADARQALEEVVQTDPLLEEAWEALARSVEELAYRARTIDERARLWQDVDAIYSNAIEYDRGYVRHRHGRAMARIRVGDYRGQKGEDPLRAYEEAEEDFVALERLGQRPRGGLCWRGLGWKNRALWREEHGLDPETEFAEAERHFTEALKEPAFAENYFHRGVVRLRRAALREKKVPESRATSDYAAAAEDFEQAIRLSPGLASKVQAPLGEARRKSVVSPR